jgi:hypothetical protein
MVLQVKGPDGYRSSETVIEDDVNDSTYAT